jgi:thiamine-monophosphate kinase
MRESSLLERIYAGNPLLPAIVSIPPGDDMAAIRLVQTDPKGSELLLAVDQVVEGIHVTRRTVDEDPAIVGRKAVARNISDVAAMAGRPLATLASVVLPKRYGDAQARELFEGVRGSAQVFGAPLIGGDTAIHRDANAPLTLSVTIVATPAWPGARVITRRGGQPGDGLFVTGLLGGSLDADGGGRHLTFEPRVECAIALLELLGDRLHAMLDLSDGLGRDAAHLTDANTRAILDASAIPARPGLSWQRALGDGEDYELLFAASGSVPSRLAGVPITRIGTILARDAGSREPQVGVRVDEGSAEALIDASRFGWEHRNAPGGNATRGEQDEASP